MPLGFLAVEALLAALPVRHEKFHKKNGKMFPRANADSMWFMAIAVCTVQHAMGMVVRPAAYAGVVPK
jgi:hypothetical protein